jgi:hypothetical protein
MAHIVRDRVLETSTTTGGSDIALAGAVTGFRSFGSVCANGDTVYYSLWGVDANNAATGEYESGLGRYSANTLTRTTVYTSSSANTTVGLSAGTKLVAISNIAQEFQRMPTRVLTVTATVATTVLTAVANFFLELEVSALYEVEAVCAMQTNVTSTGIGMVLDVPASSTICGMVWAPVTTNTIGCSVQNADAALVTTTSVTSGVINANQNQPLVGRWLVRTAGTAGTAQVMIRSEIANSTAQLMPNVSFLTGRRIS